MFILIDEYIMICGVSTIPYFSDISFQKRFPSIHLSNIFPYHINDFFQLVSSFIPHMHDVHKAIYTLHYLAHFKIFHSDAKYSQKKCGGLMTVAKLHVIPYSVFMRKNGFQIVLWSVFSDDSNLWWMNK